MLSRLMSLFLALLLGARTGLAAAASDSQALEQKFMSPKEPPVSISTIAVNKNCANPDQIEAELDIALDMANIAATNFGPNDPYVQSFWPSVPASEWAFYTTPEWVDKAKTFYACISRAVGNGSPGNCGDIATIKITCLQDELCSNPPPGYGDVHAHSDPNSNTITLCNSWFQQAASKDVACVDNKQLRFYESRALTLVHELTHLNIEPLKRRQDISVTEGQNTFVAYGVNDCGMLARKQWHHQEAYMAVLNADNFAWIAGGMYWLNYCKHKTNNDNFRLPTPWVPPEVAIASDAEL